MRIAGRPCPRRRSPCRPTGLTTKQVDARPRRQGEHLRRHDAGARTTSPSPRTPTTATILTQRSGWPPGRRRRRFDQTSRFITRFNPVPAKTADATIPLLVTVPNATAAGRRLREADRRLAGRRSCSTASAATVPTRSSSPTRSPMRASSWPRSTCRCTASPTPTNPLYQAANERTFNVDLITTRPAHADSGRQDRRLGQHWISTCWRARSRSRDNLRQGRGRPDRASRSRSATLDLTGRRAWRTSTRRASTTSACRSAASSAARTRTSRTTSRPSTLSVPGGVAQPSCCCESHDASARSVRAGRARNLPANCRPVFNNFCARPPDRRSIRVTRSTTSASAATT